MPGGVEIEETCGDVVGSLGNAGHVGCCTIDEDDELKTPCDDEEGSSGQETELGAVERPSMDVDGAPGVPIEVEL